MDNALSGPVDVLAVIKRIAETNAAFATTADRDGIVRVGESMLSLQAVDLGTVSAAVAELIEECERLCKAADGMKRNADGMSRRSPVAMTLQTAAANILSLRPLLARVGGAK